MRVYRRSDFLKLSAGTIYSKGTPWCFGGLSVKAESLANDWFCLSPMWIDAETECEQWSRLDGMLERGESYPMQEGYGRDGCFDADDIFLVPEIADLTRLRDMIDAAIAASK